VRATPVFYFSLRSPYSWLALHDLRQAYPELLAQLRLVPFWEPDAEYQTQLGQSGQAFLYSTMSREKHLYILRDVARLAARRGLRPTWPLDASPNWEVPHLAWVLADAAGKGLDFLVRATHARWHEGMDICDPEIVARIASELGLDPDSLAGAQTNAAARESGLAHLKSCIDAGVFGVPYFAIGRNAFWGIDRLNEFLAAINETPRLTGATDMRTGNAPRASTIFDHAGGCG